MICATHAGCHAVLLGGAPLDAPRYLWWNYVAGSGAWLDEARHASREQRCAMGEGDPEFIPLPESGRSTLLKPAQERGDCTDRNTPTPRGGATKVLWERL